MINDLKNKIFSGIIWQGLERFSSQVIQFIVSVILARLLAPEDFGIIALVSVFLVISDIFIDGGFRNTIIQNKEINDLSINSIFWFNLLIAMIVYLILWQISPYIAKFYSHEELRIILRVLGFIPVINSISIVNNALLIKRMLFKIKIKITLCGILLSAPVGILMAYNGFGVWSLITMRIISAITLTVITIWYVKWLPSLKFSFYSLIKHFVFSSKLLLISLLDQLFINGFHLFTGKIYNLSILAYYNRGNSYAKMGMNIINNTVSVVMFPVFTKLQDNIVELRNALQKSIKLLMFIEIPFLSLLAVCSKPLIVILLTEKWINCTFYLIMACFEYMLWPLQVLNIWCIIARGESTTALKIEIIKKVILSLSVIFTYNLGFKYLICAWTAGSILNFIVNSYPNGQALSYGPLKQIQDILIIIIISCLASVCSIIYIYVPCSMWLQLLGRITIFIIVYISLSLYFQKKLIKSIYMLIKNKLISR